MPAENETLTFAVTQPKPEYITNTLGQKVKVYDWDEYQNRLRRRVPYRGDVDLNDKHLIVKHTWGIGDLLYLTPVLREIRRKFPTVKISVVCHHPDILEGNPDIDDLWHWNDVDRLFEMYDPLIEWYWLDYDVPLKGGFDYKIHLRTKPYFNEFLIKLSDKPISELNRDEKEFMEQASNSVINRYRLVALDLYCKHAYLDPESMPNRTVYYYPHQEELDFARKLMQGVRNAGLKPIALVPHTSTVYKDYPHWRKVIKILENEPYHWIILDHRFDPAAWGELGSKVTDCSGAFKLRYSAAVAIESDLFCSSDTGLLYVRLSQGKKAISLYGPHEPFPFLAHFQPHARGLRVPYVTGLLPDGQKSCSVGCFIDVSGCHGKGQYSPCMDQLAPEVVAAEIRSALAG